MKGQTIYWVDIEYSNLDQTDSGEGGFVYAFLTACDIQSAREILIKELQAQRKTIRELILLEEYDPNTSWNSATLNAHYRSMVNSAIRAGTVAFDTFYAYDTLK